MFDQVLRGELVRMAEHDQAVRRELAADGSLFRGYHPRMEAVHRANAARLAEILDSKGWPGRLLVGNAGAEAAWLIAQHAIGDPAFMRRCRSLVEAAVCRGDVPLAHFAYLDDRINVFEGRPQRFGTQLRNGPAGIEPCPILDPDGVETRRAAAGLPSLVSVLEKSRPDPSADALEIREFEAEERRWRVRVGWATESDSAEPGPLAPGGASV